MQDPMRPDTGNRRWAALRVILGFAQVFGATLGIVLVLRTGVNALSLMVVVLTGLCTTVSVLLFGRDAPRRRS
jgi:hypothetical protein